MKIATLVPGTVCGLLVVAVVTRPIWLHLAWRWRARRSRKRHGGLIA